MDVIDGALRARMASLNDVRLRAILDAPLDDYTPQAREAAEAELSRRGLARPMGSLNGAISGEPVVMWQVESLPPEPLTDAEYETLKAQSRAGLVGPNVIFAAIVAVLIGAASRTPVIGIAAGLLVAAVTYYLMSDARFHRKLQEAEESRLVAAHREAEQLASRLMTILKDSEAVLFDVERRQNMATKHLSRARQEFSATAYAPFWDAVEGCAFELCSIQKDIRTIATYAADYAANLKGRRHTFPPLRRAVPVIDGLNETQGAFTDVVRQGQRSFQFAVIWEHRKTRGAIVEGFRTLGDAVEGVTGAIYSTSSALQTTLVNGFADVVRGYQRSEEHLASRLDRIASHTADSAAAGRDVREVISRYRLLE